MWVAEITPASSRRRIKKTTQGSSWISPPHRIRFASQCVRLKRPPLNLPLRDQVHRLGFSYYRVPPPRRCGCPCDRSGGRITGTGPASVRSPQRREGTLCAVVRQEHAPLIGARVGTRGSTAEHRCARRRKWYCARMWVLVRSFLVPIPIALRENSARLNGPSHATPDHPSGIHIVRTFLMRS